jgi:hypothetical protein
LGDPGLRVHLDIHAHGEASRCSCNGCKRLRVSRGSRVPEADGELIAHKQEHFTVVLAAVTAGRVEVLRLHRDGPIHDTVLHTLEHELDLEEMTARRHVGEP